MTRRILGAAIAAAALAATTASTTEAATTENVQVKNTRDLGRHRELVRSAYQQGRADQATTQ